eukprot:TRINITY_DN3487_c0_g1_i2.p1 TRINITY_DN3487_c0_g1~~TRINITY_DN3487_c0_g1_i2.p1  ORF type:complete len:379 (+),score=47.76 TRINITY_DN3487_c0_g1_i2:155-1291(+)
MDSPSSSGGITSSSGFLVSFKSPNKTTKWRRRFINKQDIKDFFPGATGALEVEDEVVYFENDVADLSEYNGKVINVIMSIDSSPSSDKRTHMVIDSDEPEITQTIPVSLSFRGEPGILEIFNDKDILLLSFEIYKNVGRATLSIEIILRNICGPFLNWDYSFINKETHESITFDKMPPRIFHGSFILKPVSDAPTLHNSMNFLYDPTPPHSALAKMNPEPPRKIKSSDDSFPEPIHLSPEEIDRIFTQKVIERGAHKCAIRESFFGVECTYVVSPILWNQHPRKVHHRLLELINSLPHKVYSPQNGMLLSKDIADIYNRGGCAIVPWRGKFIFVALVREVEEFDGKEINFVNPPIAGTLEFSMINNTCYFIKNNFVIS